jgi:hypothetical protein
MHAINPEYKENCYGIVRRQIFFAYPHLFISTNGIDSICLCNQEAVMDKRSDARREINASILCKRYNSFNADLPIGGSMKNCCPAGFYAELKEHVKAGTILVVRTTGSSWEASADDGLRSMALAEVRWSKPMSAEKGDCYATGLKYLSAY